jgi:hypothetical protein
MADGKVTLEIDAKIQSAQKALKQFADQFKKSAEDIDLAKKALVAFQNRAEASFFDGRSLAEQTNYISQLKDKLIELKDVQNAIKGTGLPDIYGSEIAKTSAEIKKQQAAVRAYKSQGTGSAAEVTAQKELEKAVQSQKEAAEGVKYAEAEIADLRKQRVAAVNEELAKERAIKDAQKQLEEEEYKALEAEEAKTAEKKKQAELEAMLAQQEAEKQKSYLAEEKVYDVPDKPIDKEKIAEIEEWAKSLFETNVASKETAKSQRELAKAQKEAAAASEQARLDKIAEQARNAQPELSKLSDEINDVKNRMKDMEKAGVGKGWQGYEQLSVKLEQLQTEYDSVAESSRNAAKAEQEYEVELEKQSSSSYYLNQVLLGLSGTWKLVTQGALSLAKTIGGALLTGVKKLGSALVSVGKAGLKKSISALISPFKKASKAAQSFGKRLKTAVLQGLIFRQVRTALSNVVTEMKSLLLTNTQVSASYGQLKGSALMVFEQFSNVIIPIIQKVIYYVQLALSVISKLLSLFGGLKKASADSAKAMYDQAKATSEAGGATDKFLASFDTVEKVSSSSGSGGGSDDVTPTFDFDFEVTPISGFIDQLVDPITNGDWFIVGQTLQDKLNENILTPLNNWFAGSYNTSLTSFGKNLADGLNGALFQGLNDPNTVSFGELAANFFNGLVSGFTEFTTTFKWDWLGLSIAQSINDFFSTFDFASAGTGFGAFVGGILTTIGTALAETDWGTVATKLSEFAVNALDQIDAALENVDWQQIGTNVGEFVKNIEWGDLLEKLMYGIGLAFGGFDELFWGIIESAWDEVVEWWEQDVLEDGEYVMGGLFNGIVLALDALDEWVSEHIFQPIVKALKKVFGIASPAKEMKPLGGFVGEGILEGISDIFTSIHDWIKEHIFDPVVKAIKKLFGISDGSSTEMESSGEAIGSGLANGIETAVQKIKDILNSIISAVESAVNWIIGKINGLLDSALVQKGGELFGIDIQPIPQVSLPRLAQGSVVNPGHEFAAILGDNRYEQEVVSPLSTMKQAFIEALSESGYSNSGRPVVLQIDGTTFARITNPYMAKENTRIGIKAMGV